MRPPKYPLKSLADLRDRKVDKALVDLGAAAKASEVATRRRRESELACEGHETAAARARDVERSALSAGDLTAGDLARADAWELRVAEEGSALGAAAENALGDEVAAHQRRTIAEGILGSRKADAKVVSLDRSRWEENSSKRAEAKDEEASFEAWRPSKP
jgi:hypothetical protein